MALPVELRGHAPPSRRIGRGVPAYAGGMPPARHAETPTRPRTAGTMIRIHAKAPAKPWDGAEGLEWSIPSPAPYHTFTTPPEVK